MSEFMSAKQAAQKWHISQRRVAVLCAEHRVQGAVMVGNMWVIPADAVKPEDKRKRSPDTDFVTLRPFVKWAGGKSQLVGQIDRIMLADGRRFVRYAEPMVGGGALLFDYLSRYSFEHVYISDINAELVNAYLAIRDNIDGLVAQLFCYQSLFLPLDETGRKTFYYEVRQLFNHTSLTADTSVIKAAQFIFLNKTCFNGLYRVNKKGQFNVPMGAYKHPTICDETNLRNIHRALQKVTIVCGDYSLSRSFIDADTFVYFDPPYRPISLTSAFNAYNADAFDDKQQVRLARFVDEIDALGAKVVLSNSDPKNTDAADDFFDRLYVRYTICRVSATRTINSNATKRGAICELLIHN